MAKFSVALAALLAASASAFAPQTVGTTKTALSASPLTSNEFWDPMGFYELGSGEAFDTFPNMFPDKQYLQESEIKHGRMCMLAWTGIWATTKVSDVHRMICRTKRNFFPHALPCCYRQKGRIWSRPSLPGNARR
jgi:hypothetical protein